VTQAVVAALLISPARAETQCLRQPLALHFENASDNRSELSGVALAGGKLIAVSNEGLGDHERSFVAQVFEGNPETGYSHSHDEVIHEPDGDCKEADFEALAQDGETLFAIGSHSYDRKKQNENKPHEENFRRLTAAGISACKARDKLRKFRLTGGENVETLQKTSLRGMIDAHPVLQRFADIPDKENGVDIEGLAVFAGSLYVGFRGPVLRENYVPVLRLPTDLDQIAPTDRGDDVLFVNLGGRGIRDLAPGPSDKNALYVLAGPNGDEKQSFAVFRWDGKDQLGGDGHKPGSPELLCEIELPKDNPKGYKPEGLAYLDTRGGEMRFVLVYDGKAPLKAELLTLK
jgi:hypothetical protein